MTINKQPDITTVRTIKGQKCTAKPQDEVWQLPTAGLNKLKIKAC